MSEIDKQNESLPAELVPLVEQAQHYAEQARSENTKRAYLTDWNHGPLFVRSRRHTQT